MSSFEDVQEARIEKGKRAKQAYDIYVKELLDSLRVDAFNTFCNVTADTAVLANLKATADAINSIESQIKADISIGDVTKKIR